jgi:hypothetical protein
MILPVPENLFHFRKDGNECQGLIVSRFLDLPEMTRTSLGNVQIQGDETQYAIDQLKP